ncbi:fungal-specific transcription factor domain-containing protein [Penicillium brevicompactum]
MTPRNRSLTGCGTCRLRRLKCDEARPGCQLCRIFGVPCPGYQGQLQWTQQNDDEPLDRVFRRPLFSEVEQETMSQKITDSLERQSVNAALEMVDCQPHPPGAVQLQNFSQGPFGVLNLSTDKSPLIGSMESNPSSATAASPRNVMPSPILAVSQLENPSPELSTPAPFPPSFNLQGTDNSPDRTSNLERMSAGYSYSTPEEFISTISSLFTSPPLIAPLTTSIPKKPHLIPQRAPHLIRYFSHHVRSMSYPLKGRKLCPWQTIHLPRAEQAYAELLVHGVASHTGLALFYSLLAASCFQLFTTEDHSLDYETEGNEYMQLSNYHLEKSIRQEVNCLGKIKYKELLLALLSMVMLEIRCGNYTKAQNLLVESECLIRKRGLPKAHKSLKVRTLHHIYAFTRIMAESTCGCALMEICPTRPSIRLASNEAALGLPRSFRVAEESTISDLDATLEKSSHVGIGDIHLEILGVWKESLFPEIYGLPESLIGLLSQTVRLANEQELLHRDTTVDVDLVLNLNKRTKTLEHQVLSWKPDSKPPRSRLDPIMRNSPHLETIEERYLSLAVHHALILFYYRRMHNMNALILQDTVRKVLGFIRQAEESCGPSDNVRVMLLWPAFIAGCEALESELQTGLMDWISSTGSRFSIPAFTAAANVVERVWKARKDGMDYTISWFNVMENDRCPILAV